ncbi:MAG TPA: sigma-70 family RNA polymerase sigma factor [Gemmata sp.]|nr:sigma-70 family RNA polymerase sigma factor [Gemmata sp.]
MASEEAFKEIMELLRGGDEAAAEVVVRKYSRKLIGLAAARLPTSIRAKEDEDDAVQSAFKSFFNRQKKGEFEPQDWDELGTLLTYLTLCKVDRRIRKYLAGKRDVRRETSAEAHDDDGKKWETAGPEPTADEKASAEETLRELLSRLDPTDQTILILRLQGFQVAEIAKQAGKDERTVYRVLAQVRETVAAMLSLDADVS